MQFAQGSDTRRRTGYVDFIRARGVQIKSATWRRELPTQARAFTRIHRKCLSAQRRCERLL
jgi:hypothetical protein